MQSCGSEAYQLGALDVLLWDLSDKKTRGTRIGVLGFGEKPRGDIVVANNSISRLSAGEKNVTLKHSTSRRRQPYPGFDMEILVELRRYRVTLRYQKLENKI